MPHQQRPQLHFTANRGWINDPHGLTFHNGQYHLFFQHQPNQARWAPDCRWGHATSPDLLDWTERPLALEPGDDDDGCWSGCVVVPPAGEPVLFYTSVTVPEVALGRVRRARPTDNSWDRWTKADVVATPPAGVTAATFRDPFVFRDEQQWRMLVGAGLQDGTATALVYSSNDLSSWRYDGLLAQRSTHKTSPVWTGSLWECPQLFPLDDHHVLLVSVWDADQTHYTAYAVGNYRDGTFTPQQWQRLTYGPSPYALSWYQDQAGRPGLIGWLRGITDPDEKWAGALSLPVTLTLTAGRLTATPHPNLNRRRINAAPGTTLDQARADTPTHGLDIAWTPEPDTEGSAALAVHTTNGATTAELAIRDRQLTVTTGPTPTSTPWSMPYDHGPVRIVLDGPILEIFTRTGIMALPIDTTQDQLRPAVTTGSGTLAWWLVAGNAPEITKAQTARTAAP